MKTHPQKSSGNNMSLQILINWLENASQIIIFYLGLHRLSINNALDTIRLTLIEGQKLTNPKIEGKNFDIEISRQNRLKWAQNELKVSSKLNVISCFTPFSSSLVLIFENPNKRFHTRSKTKKPIFMSNIPNMNARTFQPWIITTK